jgi:hypothetical protein
MRLFGAENIWREDCKTIRALSHLLGVLPLTVTHIGRPGPPHLWAQGR